MAVNKVIYDGTTLVDLTDNTVTSDTMLAGVTATDRSGEQITGTYVDEDTTYTLTKSGNTITLTGSDGSTTSVTDANTTYSTMTQAQATAGTSTSGYRISPKVLHDTIKNALPTVPTNVSAFTNDAGYLTSYTETGNVEFDTSASTGTTDGDLYALLVDLGWTDCIV